ncbi:MAG: type II toxin-antitoxin system VapC family toxin [Chloroflexi bacterium]|nr:type II toxin-antitoxin system VapC family toxin [Chloroflexota bacterium]
MNPPITIDASVFVSAFSPLEAGSDQSLEFIKTVSKQNTPVIVPVIVLTEVAAAISRRQNDFELAMQLARSIEALPNINFVPIDESLADLSSEVAATRRLRGSDAVYAAVSLRFGTELITLDREQLERLPKVLAVRFPG